MSSSLQVRVGVRVRPLTCDEQSQGGKQIVASCQHNNTIEILKRKFTFDGVYDESVSQSHLYSCVGADGMLEAFLDGYNSTIMAYGQTGSGKTFTMGSEADYCSMSSTFAATDEPKDAPHQGLIPRFMTDIFGSLHQRKIQDQEKSDKENFNGQDSKQNRSQLIDYQVSASFLEVYGEDIHDLLSDDSRRVLPLREDGEGGIVVVGLKEEKINRAEDALQVLHDGTLNRTTAATLMNKKSSRSHAVFTIILKQITREYRGDPSQDQGGTMDVTTVSRFTFVDLAGSERMKKTGAEGERAKEGIKINQGLLALGLVINALADDEKLTKGEKVHVPYRQSKLTRLLQDALGGNSQTLFLACVSPSDTNASETASTLTYANRARNIKNAPTKNIDASVAEMQRIYALNNVLERELVRVKFGGATNEPEDTTDGNDIGEASEELVNSDAAQAYLTKIREKAAESKAVHVAPPVVSNRDAPSIKSTLSTVSLSSMSQASSQPVRISAKSRRQSVLDSIDNSILGVNPDEDIALLDKLLELQHMDQEFDKEAKEDHKKLHQVEGELEAQEQLLLQLKENMKGYYILKDRFEAMMMEVQSLESEKTLLAKELESAQVDPSKGCSKAIKRRLDDVESKLARARSETRKNQQNFRRAEQEAQKAKALQQKIDTLKHGKVALIKKQREATATHRESTEAKSREIQTLKNKERKAGQKMTKLEAEVQKHKMNLDKRKEFCDKLSDKLKKTESHLMKVLALRKRDGAGGANSTRPTDKNVIAKVDTKQGFAPPSEEVNSLRFLLEKLVMDRAAISLLKSKYESKVAEYSDLMRSMVAEMKLLKEAKEELRTCEDEDDSSNVEQAIRDSNQTIEDLELSLEVVEGDLERIRSKLPHIDTAEVEEEPSKFESDAMKMIANLSGPVSKTLLWDILEITTKSEVAKAELDEKLKRKEAALSSFEKEIQCLNQHIIHLSQDLDRRRSFGSHSSETSSDYLSGIVELKARLSDIENDNTTLSNTIRRNGIHLEEKDTLLSTMSEKLTIMEVTMTNAGVEAKQQVQETMDKLQELWKVIGMPSNEREEVRIRIESCLELSCADALEETNRLQKQYRDEAGQLSQEIKQMYEAMGMEEEFTNVQASWPRNTTMLREIDALQKTKAQIIPTYNSAIERRSCIISNVEAALDALGKPSSELCQELADLLNNRPLRQKKKRALLAATSPNRRTKASKNRRATQFKQVEELVRALETGQEGVDDASQTNFSNESVQDHGTSNDQTGESNSLSEEYLDRCESELKKLKMIKTNVKVSNQSIREEAKQLTADMHLRGRELLSLSIHSIKKRMKDLPSWWDPHIAEEVCRSIVSREALIKVNATYTRHLEAVHDSLSSLSNGRRTLSQTLKEIVKSAHNSLLQTVEGEIDAGEAYASFDAALARLPPLSKESMNACIEEMNTLIAAVDAMAQSEVEALTVVWDALNVSNSEKGVFWGAVEESTKSFQSQSHNNFDSVLKACTTDIEEWLLCAVKDAQKIHRTLSNSLLKLNKIHEEVERLSMKQGNKSKIMSLDSELCILSAKLAEFEEKANSKQRLTRKTNSSSLLKEEKFRKQMQNNFILKVKSLSRLLSDWESTEGCKFDDQMLSTEVSKLLQHPDGVERRTAFMHLKTVQQKSKRVVHNSISPRRRNALEGSSVSSHSSRPSSQRSTNSARSNDSKSKERRRLRSRTPGALPDSASSRLGKSTSPPRTRVNGTKLDGSKSPAQGQVYRAHSPAKQNVRSTTPLSNHPSPNRRNDSNPRVLTSKQLNPRSETRTPPTRKQQSLAIRTDKNDSPILPFGQILAKTPTQKENFRF